MQRLTADSGAARGGAAPGSRDLLARPASAIFWWGVPTVAGFSTNFLPIGQPATTAVWVAALTWMGVGCALNARRCHRLHCYISAPALFLGAIGAAAAGLGLPPLHPGDATYAINASVALALLSFLIEPVWGRYRGATGA